MQSVEGYGLLGVGPAARPAPAIDPALEALSVPIVWPAKKAAEPRRRGTARRSNVRRPVPQAGAFERRPSGMTATGGTRRDVVPDYGRSAGWALLRRVAAGEFDEELRRDPAGALKIRAQIDRLIAECGRC